MTCNVSLIMQTEKHPRAIIFFLCDLNYLCIKQQGVIIYPLSKWKCNNKLAWTLKVSESNSCLLVC